MAYAMLAQAPRNTFAAALTLGFLSALRICKSRCARALASNSPERPRSGVDLLPIKSLANPWLALQGDDDPSCPARMQRATSFPRFTARPS